ncbi:MAG: hypothetical protein EHM36_11430 [Deltaproteobacteria bacterium]|nr:MAG: hypothetical protein EHM36_11430 [Deltaproteobacteria bacterium]
MDSKQYGNTLWVWNGATGAVTEYQVTRNKDKKPKVIGYADNWWEFQDYVRDAIENIRYRSTFFVVKSP